MLINRNISRLNNRLEARQVSHTPPVEFLFRDDFITAEAAPLTSPRTAEPGPGTGTIVDTGNLSSISSGRWVTSGVTGSADPSYSDNVARDRDIGLMAHLLINANGRFYFGFDSVKNAVIEDTSFHFANATLLRIFDNGTEITGVETLTALTDYRLGVIFRSAGAFYVVKGGTEFPEWTLVWVGNAETEGSQFVGIARRGSGAADFDDIRLSQLPAPWNTDDGIATSTLDGARSAGDTFTHEGDFVGEFTATAIPSGGQIEFRFRLQDTSNYWQVTIDSAGDIDLDEVVATVATERGTAAAVIANGDRVVVVADDEEIKVYEANTLRITYSSAANFKTETDGELETEGTGGSVSDIKMFPLTISGEALAPLNAVATA